MHTFSIAGKTISIFPSIAPGAPIFYLNTYAGEGQQVLDAARAAGCLLIAAVEVLLLFCVYTGYVAQRDQMRQGALQRAIYGPVFENEQRK